MGLPRTVDVGPPIWEFPGGLKAHESQASWFGIAKIDAAAAEQSMPTRPLRNHV